MAIVNSDAMQACGAAGKSISQMGYRSNSEPKEQRGRPSSEQRLVKGAVVSVYSGFLAWMGGGFRNLGRSAILQR